MRGNLLQMQILFNIFPRISLHCKLVPVQYWEYEYGLLVNVICVTTVVENVPPFLRKFHVLFLS